MVEDVTDVTDKRDQESQMAEDSEFTVEIHDSDEFGGLDSVDEGKPDNGTRVD